MALISIHQSFHFKTANLIFKYFICVCILRILSSLPSPSQFINLAMAKTRCVFLALLQIQVLNTNLTDNPREDNNSLQYESRCSNIQIIMMYAGLDILRTAALVGSVNQAAYQLQQNLGGGVETNPPGSNFDQK